MAEGKINFEETLLPALVQCFGIMFIGYVMGKTKTLGPKEAHGLTLFVRHLALPSMIFVTISTISFEVVKWEFIASVFVAKVFIFICTALMTILLTNPVDLGKSGIFAMAVTQSNDFALGYPLFISLYGSKHPEYPSYLYIIAPIQLLVLNTVGFFMLEIEKRKNDQQKQFCQFLQFLKGTLVNPIVLATIIGMIWNVTYGPKILPIFDTFLKTFSSAFAATALVLVGYTMAEESEITDNHISLTVALLVITKNLILPLFLQKFSSFALVGSTEQEIQSFRSFGFLYGTIPTAPSVYVFSIQYEMAVDIITKTIISSTLVSAPLMFASASVISISQTGIENLSFYLSQTISYVSSINFLCCMWLLILIFMGKRWVSVCFGPILLLLIAQFLMACGGLLLFFPYNEHSALFYTQYFLTISAVYATRFGAVFLSILLYVLRRRSLCFILHRKKKINHLSAAVCIVLPFIITLSILGCKSTHRSGPNFQLGFPQIVATSIVTGICLFFTVLFLVLQHVCFRKKNENAGLTEQSENIYQNAIATENQFNNPDLLNKRKEQDEIIHGEIFSTDVEDLGRHLLDDSLVEESANSLPQEYQSSLCDARFQCSAEQRLQCTEQVSSYVSKCQEMEIGLYNDRGIFKHTILLITLCVAMTLSFSVCIWKLYMEEIDGIFIELEYLDTLLNYGLGIIYLILFGLDTKLLGVIRKKWRQLLYRKQLIDINNATPAHICNHFMSFHYEKCKLDIGRTKILNGIQYKYAFNGADLVEWLIENNVTDDNKDAEKYGTYLLRGHVIETIDCTQYFSQNPCLFKFTRKIQL